MRFGGGGLLGHAQDAVVCVDGNDAALEEFLVVGLPKAHDAGGLLLAGIAHETLQAEVQQVVAGNDEHVVVEMEQVDGKLYVAHGSEACLVGGGAVVHDSHLLSLRCSPLLEVTGELMVRDDDVFIDQSCTVDVVDEPVEDSFFAHLEERLGEVLCEGIKAGSIARSKD